MAVKEEVKKETPKSYKVSLPVFREGLRANGMLKQTMRDKKTGATIRYTILPGQEVYTPENDAEFYLLGKAGAFELSTEDRKKLNEIEKKVESGTLKFEKQEYKV